MTSPVLLLTQDDGLREDLLRLAAAAGARLDVVSDVDAAVRSWSAAAAVLVGADLLEPVTERRPPAHPELHVVARETVPDRVFRHALAVGARDVVEVPVAAPWLVSLLADVVEGTGGCAVTVGVVAGAGGAGATTFAAALAQVGARSGATVLIDLDPWGAGLDRVLGLDEIEGVRWDALAELDGRLGSRTLRDALPARDGLAVLTWSGGSGRVPDASSVAEVMSAAQRGSDLLVVDLPRQLGDGTEGVVARCGLVVVVVEADVLSVSAAGKVARRLEADGAPVGVVVRASRGLDPDAVAAALGLPLLATLATRRRVGELVDLGLGPVGSGRSPLVRAARSVLAVARERKGRPS